MTLIIKGAGLTIEDVVNVARHNEKVELHPEAVERIKACRAMLERKIDAGEIMYGVNTGIGEFSEVVLNDEQVEDFQKYLIYNHAAGIGDPMPLEYVRGAMLGRINVHAHGNSGCRPEITQTLLDMLNKGVTPWVCQKGSVGASGDLAPMSQIALLMMGEGEAFYQGERIPGGEALEKAGIEPLELFYKEGLGLINGSQMMTGEACLQLVDSRRLIKNAIIAAAMTIDALKGVLKAYHPKLHEARPHKGQMTTAHFLNRIFDTGYYMETNEPGGISGNPGAWSPARHIMLRLGVSF